MSRCQKVCIKIIFPLLDCFLSLSLSLSLSFSLSLSRCHSHFLSLSLTQFHYRGIFVPLSFVNVFECPDSNLSFKIFTQKCENLTVIVSNCCVIPLYLGSIFCFISKIRSIFFVAFPLFVVAIRAC